jgi:uncharacterized membrane protein
LGRLGLSGLANCAPRSKLSTKAKPGPEVISALSEIACRIPVRNLAEERRALRLQDEERARLRRLQRRERSERHAGYGVYWLYLTAPFSAGITALIGLLMASSRAPDAAPLNATHFRFQVWSFWSSFLAGLTGGAWAITGGVASVAGDAGGAQLALAGGGLAALSAMGFFAASLFGLTRLSSRAPMGRLEHE